MLVSGFPGRGYLSAASPMLVALCTCVLLGEYKSYIFCGYLAYSLTYLKGLMTSTWEAMSNPLRFHTTSNDGIFIEH